MKGEVQEEKWGSWLRADQVGRKEVSQQQNTNPNNTSNETGGGFRPKNPTPVNLLKGLASLSVNNTQENGGKGEEEVQSKMVTSTKAKVTTLVMDKTPVDKSDDNFHKEVEKSDLGGSDSANQVLSHFSNVEITTSQGVVKTQSLKQLARRQQGGRRVLGVKRPTDGVLKESGVNKICNPELLLADIGEGVTQQRAPSDP
ncbi:hypothetical protein PIB30_066481 [Stylosanthes scabra]|uniref:Uncharacterized protein n=1 Tax=Stylosanthes scabra TaxID=79078 RepID=A0ABU6ZL17_9FABA|nr:hypothetical protein [Stylosanthes scabra]